MQPNVELFTRLLKERIIFIGTPIDDTVANLIVAQLHHLETEDRGKQASLYINSPGGSVTASLAIYDTMQRLECPVATYGIGAAEGTAALLLCAGSRGRRFALPHARITLGEIWGGAPSEERAAEIVRLTKILDEAFARHTGKPVPEIVQAREKRRAFSPKDAVAFGLIDDLVQEVPS